MEQQSKKSDFYTQSGKLTQSWYAIAQSRQIGQSKPFSAIVFGIPLVVWRDENGNPQALLDRCNHRHAPLSDGRIEKHCVVCPYHGWIYDGSGACKSIPSEGPHVERIPPKKVEQFPSVEKYGLIWIWMGRAVPPNGEPFPMPMKTSAGWHSYYMETDFENDVTNLVENFMDVPHTVFVHKGWFRDPRQMRIAASVERTENSVLVSYNQPKDAISFSSKLLNPKGLPMVHTDHFYMPNTTRVDYVFGDFERAFIITSTCTPIDESHSKVFTLIGYRFGWLNPLAALFLPAYTRKVITQDVDIMALQRKNLNRFEPVPFQSTQADTMHIYIESLRNYAMDSENFPKPAPIKKEIEFWV